MPKVKIVFSGDVTEIGKVRTVSAEDAATMVREGRAQHVAEPPAAPAPEPAPAASRAARS